MERGSEGIAFLAASEARSTILELLCRNGSLTERELRDRADYARTTVHRNLDALLDLGWIERDDGRYVVTTCGEIVAAKFAETKTTVATASRLEPFLRWVSRDELDLDLTLLRDAEVTVGDARDPLATVNRAVRPLRRTSTVRAVWPVLYLHPFEVGHRRIREGELEAEYVVPRELLGTLASRSEYARLARDMLDSDRFELRVYDGEIPFSLGIFDGTIQLGASEDGEPKALVETSAADARAWAERRYADYRRAARPIDPAAISKRGRRRPDEA